LMPFYFRKECPLNSGYLTDAVQAIEAYRGSPQLMEERLNALTENQRWVSEARAALVVEVLKLESAGNLGRLKAI
ncbi:hypothetical protein UQ77_27225, partial [Shigella flexneri]|uniref:hypothetical protein n=1 Tax=Shigella flexneri TaxID=623 RepID=UPI000EE950FD